MSGPCQQDVHRKSHFELIVVQVVYSGLVQCQFANICTEANEIAFLLMIQKLWLSLHPAPVACDKRQCSFVVWSVQQACSPSYWVALLILGQNKGQLSTDGLWLTQGMNLKQGFKNHKCKLVRKETKYEQLLTWWVSDQQNQMRSNQWFRSQSFSWKVKRGLIYFCR